MTQSWQNDPMRTQYEEQGYVIARNVLDESLVAEAAAHVEWLLKRHPDLRPEQLGHTLVADDPFWVRLVSDERLLDIAAKFIGEDIALFASHYICKPPGDGQAVLWHQDGSYWPLDPMRVVSLWLAVDESTPENGCLRVIPGSHRESLKELQPRADGTNVLGSGLDIDAVQAKRAVDLRLSPGDVSIHHPNIIHGSEPNTSSRWRRGLTIRYIPTSTRITTPKPWPCAFLLRGKAVPGVNDYLPRPPFDPSKHSPSRMLGSPGVNG